MKNTDETKQTICVTDRNTGELVTITEKQSIMSDIS